MTAPEIINSDIYLALNITILVFSAVCAYFFRNDPIFKQRSYPVEFLWMFNLIAQTIRFRLILESIVTKDPWPCVATIFNAGVQTAAWAFAGLIRCVRLYLVYNIAKDKFRQDIQTEDNEKRPFTPSRWWLDPKYLHWSYMYLLYFSLVLIFQIFPLVTAAVGLVKYDNTLPVSYCAQPIGRSGSIAALATLTILICVIGWNMRGVHDAFFMKKELNILAFFALFICIPSQAMTFVYPSWGWVSTGYILTIFSIVSFLIPSILAIKNRIDTYRFSSSSEFSEDTTSRGTASDVVPDKKVKGTVRKFPNFPKIQKVLNDPRCLQFLEEYLVHYQDFDLSNQLLCWSAIIKFKEGEDDSGVPGRAWLLYRKFLSPDSYIQVQAISQPTREELATKLSAVVAQEEEIEMKNVDGLEVTINVFDEALAELEFSLAENLFKNFFKSEFYVKFQESKVLQVGLQVV